MDSNILQIIANLDQVLDPYWGLLFAIAYISGFCVLVGSLAYLRHCVQTKNPVGGGLTGAACGVLLLSLPTVLDGVSHSIFNAQTPIFSSVPAGNGVDAVWIRFSIRVVRLVGLYAVIKGILIFRANARSPQGGAFWRGAVHFVMGAICINMVTFMRALAISAGGVLKDIIFKLLPA